MTLLVLRELTCFKKAEKISVRKGGERERVSQSRNIFCQSGESEALFPVELCTPPVLSVPVGPLGDSFSSASEGNAVERLQTMKKAPCRKLFQQK